MALRLLVIDFGSQFTRLIARRFREMGVYSEIHAYSRVDGDFLRDFSPIGIVLSGGPGSVLEVGSPRVDGVVFDFGVPVLGICYGEQVMCYQLGGEVSSGGVREFGASDMELVGGSALFAGVAGRSRVWMSHGDSISVLPVGFSVIGRSLHAPYCAIEDRVRRFYGIQFHPEVTHTVEGFRILSNFAFRVCSSYSYDVSVGLMRSSARGGCVDAIEFLGGLGEEY